MQFSASDEYFTTQVLTAAPQKLQLMLIEGALRSCKRAEGFWKSGAAAAVADALLHAQRIMARLIADLNYFEHPRLAVQMAAVYGFVYKSLVLAHLRHDAEALTDAVRILLVERETWRLACEKYGSRLNDGSAMSDPAMADPAPIAPRVRPPAPHHRGAEFHASDRATADSISFEA